MRNVATERVAKRRRRREGEAAAMRCPIRSPRERTGKAGGLAERFEPILYMMSNAPHHDALLDQRRIERPCPERSQRWPA
jgi:hypothetical protein